MKRSGPRGVSVRPATAMSQRVGPGRINRALLRIRRISLAVCIALGGALSVSLPVQAQDSALAQVVAQAAQGNPAIAAFYQQRNFEPLWTGNANSKRWQALMDVLNTAAGDGLPAARYDQDGLKAAYGRAGSGPDRAVLEIRASQVFLNYASDLQSGIVDPGKIDPNMTLDRPRRDPLNLLDAFSKSTPSAFFQALQPQSPEYKGLLAEKQRLELIVASGGWGPTVTARALKPGDSGPQVVILRGRLSALNYGNLGSSGSYDADLERAVSAFQTDNGLNSDGIAGSVTLAAVNMSAQDRLIQVIVGLERLRWLNKLLGSRHIIVNEAAFTATLFDNGKPTFMTKVVVGKPGRWRTPEFERAVTHMIINPSWFVPGSIAGGEYLPQLLQNPEVLDRQGIVMTDTTGATVDPTTVDFSQYTKDNFPFTLRQAPGDDNALGVVKFMFPNRHAIYLHDTPAKSLFARDIRTFSHGCVRVEDPYGLAYALLAPQSSDPKALFDGNVAAGQEVTLTLDQPVPIYLVYRTAWVDQKGRVNFRADSYDVDRKVFDALHKAGVTLN